MTAKKKIAEVKVSPSKVPFKDTATGKVLVVTLYQGAAFVCSQVITAITNNPNVFGKYTMLVQFVISNVALVALAKYTNPNIKNI